MERIGRLAPKHASGTARFQTAPAAIGIHRVGPDQKRVRTQELGYSSPAIRVNRSSDQAPCQWCSAPTNGAMGSSFCRSRVIPPMVYPGGKTVSSPSFSLPWPLGSNHPESRSPARPTCWTPSAYNRAVRKYRRLVAAFERSSAPRFSSAPTRNWIVRWSFIRPASTS